MADTPLHPSDGDAAGFLRRQEDRHVDIGDVEQGQHPPAGAQHLAQPLEVDRAILDRHDQPHLFLLVAQEEVLDVVAGQVAAQRLRLLDGEDRRVLDALLGDAELGQPGEELLGVEHRVTGPA